MSTAITAAILALIVILPLVIRFKNRKRRCCKALLLIPVAADDGLFERRVKACYWEEAFSDPLYAKDILLVTGDVSPNTYAAQRLAQEYATVHTVHISSLGDYLQRNYFKESKKTDS